MNASNPSRLDQQGLQAAVLCMCLPKDKIDFYAASVNALTLVTLVWGCNY